MDREKRNEERAARYRVLSEKARERSAQAFQGADAISGMIPMGQPILIGHHSERRHRRDIERIDSRLRKGFEEEKKAEYFNDKAHTAENSKIIHSDDDNAIEKLKEKLTGREKLQSTMVKANAIYRKPMTDDAVIKLMALGLTKENAIGGWQPDFCGRIGFPAYALQNNNAEIRRIKQRIEKVSAMQARPETVLEVGAAQVRENAEFNSVEISFPGKPSPEVIESLKANGFRWARTSKVWYRKGRNDWLVQLAQQLAGKAAA